MTDTTLNPVTPVTNGAIVTSINPLPTYNAGVAPVGGGITWGAPTAIAVTAGPTSTVLIAANAARKALRIWNPVGNAQMSYDLAGGTAVLATGTPLQSGSLDWFTGADCPVGAVTFIGTAGQSLVYQQGT
jgi:hypothetical protein